MVLERNGTLLIKRVVAIGGDRVAIEDGVLVINGVREREPYVDYSLTDESYSAPLRVPAGKVFVLGDNRPFSRDSRAWGPIDADDVIGRVDFLLWPPSRAGTL